MASRKRWLGYAVVAALLMGASDLHAQVIGTFRWQLAPFCNVVTMTVQQQGASFLLTGFDDQCGQPVAAAATGTAHFNADGTVGIGLTVIRPDGRAVHNTVILNLATVSGTWTTAGAANFIKVGEAPTANCPGSSANPEAAPGHLCVYERLAVNVSPSRCIARTTVSAFALNFCDQADRFGAAVFAEADAAADAASHGSWAVTIP